MVEQIRKNFIVPEVKNYTCEHCGVEVVGGRYNNHCPNCLWSKHVDDKIPGDRSSNCLGLMEPVKVLQKNGKWRIVHKCTKCNHIFEIETKNEDNLDLIIKLSLLNWR